MAESTNVGVEKEKVKKRKNSNTSERTAPEWHIAKLCMHG